VSARDDHDGTPRIESGDGRSAHEQTQDDREDSIGPVARVFHDQKCPFSIEGSAERIGHVAETVLVERTREHQAAGEG
jgi:hypothetical protein